MSNSEKVIGERYLLKRQPPETIDQIIMEQSKHFRIISCLHFGEHGPYITEHFPLGMEKDELLGIYNTMLSVEDISVRDLSPDSDITIENPSERRITIITNVAAGNPDIQISYIWTINKTETETELQIFPYHAAKEDPNYEDILERAKTANRLVVKRISNAKTVTSL